MKTKTIPFDIETAKKIQAGCVAGRIVTDTKMPVKILCFDRKVPEYIIVGLVNGYSVFCYSKDGVSEPQPERITHTIYIELPEEAPKPQFKPFDKVLVRYSESDKWSVDFFSYYDEEGCVATATAFTKYCIPYEGNEHLLGTTDKPKEE